MTQDLMTQDLMTQDTAIFVGSVALLVGYLIFSAKTEMGTKINIRWPWEK